MEHCAFCLRLSFVYQHHLLFLVSNFHCDDKITQVVLDLDQPGPTGTSGPAGRRCALVCHEFGFQLLLVSVCEGLPTGQDSWHFPKVTCYKIAVIEIFFALFAHSCVRMLPVRAEGLHNLARSALFRPGNASLYSSLFQGMVISQTGRHAA